MQDMIGLDFETYSDVDLPKHGLDRYISSPYFLPLIASVAKQGVSGRTYTQRYQLFDHRDQRQFQNDINHAVRCGVKIVAHNSGFEMAVLGSMNIQLGADNFVDSAMVARAAGAESKLEVAAPQLIGMDKLEVGWSLIKLFCMPGPYQEKHNTRAFVPDIVLDHPAEWDLFGQYCDVDANAGLTIAEQWGHVLTGRELRFQQVTQRMNEEGWHVDLDAVQEMQRRYLENQERALEDFRQRHNAADLNLRSLAQMKKWCADRGVKITSMDEAHVARYRKAIEKKLYASVPLAPVTAAGYQQVLDLMSTKQILGGSSLSKLETIMNMTGEDGRLRDQYLHCGAGQTLRTTGRGVQMQNLKRIGDEPADMDELFDDYADWDNELMARNLRQVFTAEKPDGFLIVGDFASVESRGLAWLAGAQWKTTAFKENKDLYKVLASSMFSVPYDAVSKEQRQTGKVGELSCGYGAGPQAVRDFAVGMGVEFEEGEATKLVHDWRNTNPEIVKFWGELDRMMHESLEVTAVTRQYNLPDGFVLQIGRAQTPKSLWDQAKTEGRDVQSLSLEVWYGGMLFLRRFFHGCYPHGRNVRYYRPTERKTGKLWKDSYRHPKSKQIVHYELYGGKLSGILTQSFCRELFMQALEEVDLWCRQHDELRLVGQFHDEIVVDWRPSPYGLTLETAKRSLNSRMSDPGEAFSFPLAAEIKHDYRYTK